MKSELINFFCDFNGIREIAGLFLMLFKNKRIHLEYYIGIVYHSPIYGCGVQIATEKKIKIINWIAFFSDFILTKENTILYDGNNREVNHINATTKIKKSYTF